MVKIRLRRTGTKKKPSYRVVVADISSPRDGRFIEIIGHYNPRTTPTTVEVHEDRVLHWLSVGAQPTDPVRRLLENMGTFEKLTRVRQGETIESVLATEPQSDEEVQSDATITQGTTEDVASAQSEEV